MVVFDKSEEQIVATLKGHTKKVTSVIYHPSQVTFSLFQTSTSPILLQQTNPVTALFTQVKKLFELLKHRLNMIGYSFSLFALFFRPSHPCCLSPSSPWSFLRLQTTPSVCGLSPGVTVSRLCVPTRQVSLDSLYTLLGTTCSAPLRIRCVCTDRP